MIKPKALKAGDTIAIVSLSSGMGGDELFRYRYEIGKKRLEEEFGFRVVTMPNALKGSEYLYQNPKARAEDLMKAFLDPSIDAIICMIGGDDSIRLLPYIDYDVIASHPKIFMGYSDSTVNHFMMYKAGLVSFQGPCVLVEFAENVEMHPYTKKYIREVLIEGKENVNIHASESWTSEYLEWTDPKNQHQKRTLLPNDKGYEILQGSGWAQGELLGGCLSVMAMLIGTEIWPDVQEWEDKILYLETAEDYPTPEQVLYFLRNLAAQGIINRINGIIVGKPLDEKYYEEYKNVYRKVIGEEAKRPDLPIIYNVNCSHTAPICILPNGIRAEIDCTNREITLLESAVI